LPGIEVKRSRLVLLGVGLAAAAVAWTCGGTSRHGVLDELGAARLARVFSPRLSIPTEYRPCAVVRTKPVEAVPRDSCGAPDDPPVALDTLAGESSDPDSLQAFALLAMMGSAETHRSPDAAIASLSRALPLSRGQVPLLVDLSAAHLVRAQRTQNARDLLAGLDYAREALDGEPHNAAALFNAALALETLALDEQAALAWTAYLHTDSTSRWAEEARGRRRRALRNPPAPRTPGLRSSEQEVRAFATHHPQQARLLGWDDVLGRWGTALEAGDTAGAAGWLRLAERLGATLVERGGDASLSDAVAAIHAAAGDPAATHVLARAHRRYAAGQVLYGNSQHAAAADSFSRVVGARPRSPVLLLSAEVFHGATFVYAGKVTRAESVLQALLPRIDSVRYPALAARTLWMRYAGPLRNGRFREARAPFEAAARLFERARETEFTGATWAMAGEAAYGQRDTLAAYRLMHRGMSSLRGYRSSVWLHNALMVLAKCAAADGMPGAASIVQDEDVAVATRRKESPSPVEALLGRARIRWAVGERTEAARDIDRAEVLRKTIHAQDPREFLASIVRFSRATVATDTASLADVDSAVAYFSKPYNPIWLLPVLVRRADIHLARRELNAAAADLTTATERIRDLSQRQDDAALRVAVMEQARGSFDRLVMLHLRDGHTVQALQALERGRVSFAPVRASAPSVDPRRPMAPPGHVAVEYALIGDTLLTWTVRGDDVQLLRRTVDRGELLLRIERVCTALESLARAASAGPDLRWLYDQLVRPVQDRLGASGTPLVILADGELAGVPFSALRDSGQGRYLMEDHVLRFAASLADAARPAPRTDGPARRVLLVADPAFDDAEYPRLDRLRAAQAEVDSIHAMYPAAIVRADSFATRDAFTTLAPHVALIHYAGHALFDDTRPERSALVLAGHDTTGRLTAEAVNALQLRGVRLVVLAACRTLRSREERSGGFAGFSGALLAAGAGGVVGSLWRVDDRLTRPFMLEFHRAYLGSGDPAAALRDAQMHLLDSRDPALRSPAAWAGFRYIGS
jgi:CHAT domain-containing protein